MIAQILAQLDPIALPIGENLSIGAIVMLCLWYLYNENQKLKAENKEVQGKYEELVKDCHQREMESIRSNHSPRRNEN